jgi:hypothetical protein
MRSLVLIDEVFEPTPFTIEWPTDETDPDTRHGYTIARLTS